MFCRLSVGGICGLLLLTSPAVLAAPVVSCSVDGITVLSANNCPELPGISDGSNFIGYSDALPNPENESTVGLDSYTPPDPPPDPADPGNSGRYVDRPVLNFTNPNDATDVRQIAAQYDEFWVYDADQLKDLQGEGFLAGFGFIEEPDGEVLPYATGSAGLGGLDAVAYTQAQGADNQGIGVGGAFNLEDPSRDPSGGTVVGFSGGWGECDPSLLGSTGTAPVSGSLACNEVNGPNTVGDILAYLQGFDPDNSIPVWYVDLNQTGTTTGQYVYFGANVVIQRPDGTIEDSWSLDLINNGSPDASTSTADGIDPTDGSLPNGECGTVSNPLPCDPVTDSTAPDFEILEENLALNTQPTSGSGDYEFIFVAPQMNLLNYDPTYTFSFRFTIGCDFGEDPKAPGCLNNGGEEIYLTGAFVGPDIPAPATMGLMAAGLLGAGAWSRRRRRA